MENAAAARVLDSSDLKNKNDSGFDPPLLSHLSGINIYITFAGFALIYASVKATAKTMQGDRQPLPGPAFSSRDQRAGVR